MRKNFIMPSLEVRRFAGISMLTESANGTNMAAAKAQTVTINNQSVKINDMTKANAALK